MYIHLGNNYIISAGDIIANLSLEPPVADEVKEIIEIAKIDKKITNVSEKGKEKTNGLEEKEDEKMAAGLHPGHHPPCDHGRHLLGDACPGL